MFLVRHGESEWNVARLTQGQSMAPALTDRGRSQARSAAERLAAALPPGRAVRMVSSDLIRAVQTAEILGRRLGAPQILHDKRLREQDLGDLEGRGYEETWAAAEAHDWSDPTLPVGGGESPAQVHARMGETVDQALAATGGGAIVLVSHGDAIRAAVAHLHGHAAGAGPWTDVPNGVVLRIRPGAVERLD